MQTDLTSRCSSTISCTTYKGTRAFLDWDGWQPHTDISHSDVLPLLSLFHRGLTFITATVIRTHVSKVPVDRDAFSSSLVLASGWDSRGGGGDLSASTAQSLIPWAQFGKRVSSVRFTSCSVPAVTMTEAVSGGVQLCRRDKQYAQALM